MAYVGHVGNQADKQATFRFKGTFFSMTFWGYQKGLCLKRKIHARQRELPWSEAYSYIPKKRNI